MATLYLGISFVWKPSLLAHHDQQCYVIHHLPRLDVLMNASICIYIYAYTCLFIYMGCHPLLKHGFWEFLILRRWDFFLGNPMPETHFGTLGMVCVGFYHINWGCLRCLAPICGNIEDYSLFNTNTKGMSKMWAMAAMSHPNRLVLIFVCPNGPWYLGEVRRGHQGAHHCWLAVKEYQKMLKQ